MKKIVALSILASVFVGGHLFAVTKEELKVQIDAKNEEIKRTVKEKVRGDSELRDMRTKMDAKKEEKNQALKEFKEKVNGDFELREIRTKMNAKQKKVNRGFKEFNSGNSALQSLKAQKKIEQYRKLKDSLKRYYYNPLVGEIRALRKQYIAKKALLKKQYEKQYIEPLIKEFRALRKQYRAKKALLKKQYIEPLRKEFNILAEQYSLMSGRSMRGKRY